MSKYSYLFLMISFPLNSVLRINRKPPWPFSFINVLFFASLRGRLKLCKRQRRKIRVCVGLYCGTCKTCFGRLKFYKITLQKHRDGDVLRGESLNSALYPRNRSGLNYSPKESSRTDPIIFMI